MPVDTKIVTTDWQEIANGPLTITVQKKGAGPLFFSTTGSDNDPFIGYNLQPGRQLIETEARSTYVKAGGAGYELYCDGAVV